MAAVVRVCGWLVCWLMPLLWPAVSGADEAPAPETPAVAALTQRLTAFDQLTGDFKQQLFGENGQLLQTSEGRYALLRPGFLRWHIVSPEEQILVAANDSLWHYDVELETASERYISSGDPTNPLTILGGNPAVLARFYDVQQPEPDRFLLTPLFTDAEFDSVALEFDGGLPTALEIQDQLRRRTRILLDASKVTSDLSPDDFVFLPPEGVDVYQHER